MLVLADWLLTAAHVIVILGFMLLWIPRATVRLHRWLVVLVALSWLGLGFFYGFGYCVLTDLHWQVKRARGVDDLPGSFIKYAGDFLTQSDLASDWVNAVTAASFIAGVAAALWRYLQATRTRAARHVPDKRGNN